MSIAYAWRPLAASWRTPPTGWPRWPAGPATALLRPCAAPSFRPSTSPRPSSDLKKPDWAVVRLEILGPLAEVGRQLDDELARRTTKNPMLPIDRDPVPNRYSELVR